MCYDYTQTPGDECTKVGNARKERIHGGFCAFWCTAGSEDKGWGTGYTGKTGTHEGGRGQEPCHRIMIIKEGPTIENHELAQGGTKA